MSRLVNCVTNAINTKLSLPKWMIIVTEDDLLKDNTAWYVTADDFKQMLDWVMAEHAKVITRFKSYMPVKAKKYQWPLILWVIPTLHVNYNNFSQCKEFISGLRMAANDHNVGVIPLRQLWNPKDSSLFTARQQQYTNGGLNILWTAMDRAIKFADTGLHRNSVKHYMNYSLTTRMKRILSHNLGKKPRKHPYTMILSRISSEITETKDQKKGTEITRRLGDYLQSDDN